MSSCTYYHIHTYTFARVCVQLAGLISLLYVCTYADLMAKLEQIQQVMLNVAHRIKKVRDIYVRTVLT